MTIFNGFTKSKCLLLQWFYVYLMAIMIIKNGISSRIETYATRSRRISKTGPRIVCYIKITESIVQV